MTYNAVDFGVKDTSDDFYVGKTIKWHTLGGNKYIGKITAINAATITVEIKGKEKMLRKDFKDWPPND